MFNITKSASKILDEKLVIRDTDRTGYPHILVKVPDMELIPDAELGLEVAKDDDGAMVLTLLIHDRPSEPPVIYEIKLLPSEPGDLKFLRCMIDAAQFRMHPSIKENGNWRVGASQTLRIPPNVLLRLKHYSLEWPLPSPGPKPEAEKPALEIAEETPPQDGAPKNAILTLSPKGAQPDPRDTVIRKLKEQNHILRDQIRTKDKRIIELEDELNEIRSKGRSYKLGEKKNWWNPF